MADPTAKAVDYQAGACECKECKSACTYRPGWFSPEQIVPLAANMGLTVKELFGQHLQVDWWSGSPDIFLLAPRLKSEDGGTMYPGNPRGTCGWFKDGKCSVHEHGKPAECQMLGHGPDGKRVLGDREQIAMRWNTPEHQQFVRDLYGQELEAEAFSIFDMLGSSYA